ncbi:MAG: nucleotidyltransferase family protein [Terriglobales bacterium]
MNRAPSWCGVILAAGESSRMGSDKALLPWPPVAAGLAFSGETFLSAAIRSLSAVTDQVVVVVGDNASVLAPVVYASGGSLVRNPTPEDGQFSSLRVGLKTVLDLGRDAAMITLVDRPPAGVAELAKLRSAFESSAGDTWAVVPEFNGRHGHPFLAGREMIEIFLKAPATATAREIEHQHQQHLQYVAVEDPHVVMNVNTPEDYAALLNPQIK